MVCADTTSGTISGNKFIAGVLLFGSIIRASLSGAKCWSVLLPTSGAGAIANMAVLMQGKTIVNLNYTANPEAIAGAIKAAGIRQVLTSSRFLSRLEKRGIDLSEPLSGVEVLAMEDLNSQIPGYKRLLAFLQAVALPGCILNLLHASNTQLDDTAAILFSSGSEGTPKGVMLSHRNIMANLKQISDVLNTEDQDVMMATLPLFHAFGLTVTTFMPLVEGIPFVCHPDPTDAVNIGKAAARYRATLLFGTSTFLRLYARNKRVHPLMFSSLRLVVAGAEKLSPDVREAFKLKFNVEVFEGYGATETTPVASVNIPDRLDTTYWQVQTGARKGTVGMPLPGTSFRIVDPETMEELPTGEDGLILIGGAQVMQGYLNDPQKTAEVIAEIDGERWYKTGDKGHLDEDGFLTIVDRYSRFAKLGGEMVSLTAVEEQVRATLNITDLDLVAVSIPDAKKGEQIILLAGDDSQDADVLRQTLTASEMNALMVPSKVYCLESVPKLGTGKTDFRTARELALELSR